tara:strand:- start:29 stop:1510 length:1482 start_codon:yes stop_codon:yes gene_type:complete
MDQIIKIDANQGTFDTSGNKSTIDIDIPAGLGNLDLSKSYVNIRTKCSIDIANATNEVANLNMEYRGSATGANQNIHYPDTASLIVNAYMGSNKKGKLEDIRHVDILKTTLSSYRYNMAEQKNDVGKVSAVQQAQMVRSLRINEINKIGTDSSRNTSNDIVIPLKNIFNICKAESYNTDAYGQTRIHLEAGFHKLKILDAGITDYNLAVEGRTAKAQQFAGFTVAAAQNTLPWDTLTSTALYKNAANIPFHVDQNISISYTKGGAAQPVKNNLNIASITRNADDTITLVLNGGIYDQATGDVITAVLVKGDTNARSNDAVAIEKVEAVLYVNNSGDAAPASIPYTTYLSEEDTYSAALFVSRLYHVPPACKNVYVMFFSDGIISGATHLAKYRFTVNNKEITPRSVSRDSPIHFDLIGQTFLNNGETPKSMRQVLYKTNSRVGVDEEGESCKMLAIPMPFLQEQQTLQLELDAVAGEVVGGHHILFYEVVKNM